VRCAVYAGATLGLFVCFAHGQDAIPTSIDRCNQLAASDLDTERPASVPGVSVGAIDADAAIAACEAAVATAPDDRRLIYQLGRAYYAAKNFEKARVAYAHADAMGHVAAAHNLGAILTNGSGVSRDRAEARRLFEKAAAAGFAMSMHNLGREFEIDRDFMQARQWYAQAASQGFSPSFISLGQLFENGLGVQQDHLEACRWYERAAASGNVSATTNIVRLFTKARGVPQDQQPQRQKQKARWSYGKGGGPTDCRALGLLGLWRFGKPDDQPQRWLEEAAARGDRWAMYRLAELYENGWGVASDLVQARHWYVRAIGAGDDKAIADLAREDLARLDAAARGWLGRAP
jgi:tetratricopeptide (TPR) repeat protein